MIPRLASVGTCLMVLGCVAALLVVLDERLMAMRLVLFLVLVSTTKALASFL